MANGIIVIDKPPDWTSHDVVAKIRGILHEKRVGHAGTLDPMATGVLPVFVGRATRAVEFAAETGKTYVAGLKLGVVTDTQDTTGTVLEEHPVSVTREALEAVLAQFRGPILQIPPMFSALKRDGKKLYELARKGVEVEREPRPITIYELELQDRGTVHLSCNGDKTDEPSPCLADFTLRVRCSKGTYIRTLCHDIGQALGCGGAMCSLRRTEAAGFTLADAVSLDQVSEAALLPVDSYFADRPILLLSDAAVEKQIRNGMAVPMEKAPPGEYRVYAMDKTFLAVSRAENGTLTTIKSFFEP